MHKTFSENAWTMDALTRAYSWRFDQTPIFTQLADCVTNRPDENAPEGYEWIGLLTEKKCGEGQKITTRCAFEGSGAPIIVLAKELTADDRGVLRHGDYIEIVLYKNGVNVWQMDMQNGEVTWKKRMGVQFPVEENEIHTLSVEVRGKNLHIEADGRVMEVYIGELYDAYYAGINACEGICRFYDLDIE